MTTYEQNYQALFGDRPARSLYGQPIGYYASSAAALAMEQRYGSHLEQLSRINLRACLSILSKVAYCVQAADDAGQVTDWSVANELSCGYLTVDAQLRSLLIAFDNETSTDADAFCCFLGEQLASPRE